MKFEDSDSTVCMTPLSQNVRLSESPHFILNVSSPMIAVLTKKGFYQNVPLRATRDQQCFRFWFRGVQIDSAVLCTPQSLTQQCDAHRGVWLFSMMHTAESSYLDIFYVLSPRCENYKLMLFLLNTRSFGLVQNVYYFKNVHFFRFHVCYAYCIEKPLKQKRSLNEFLTHPCCCNAKKVPDVHKTISLS